MDKLVESGAASGHTNKVMAKPFVHPSFLNESGADIDPPIIPDASDLWRYQMAVDRMRTSGEAERVTVSILDGGALSRKTILVSNNRGWIYPPER